MKMSNRFKISITAIVLGLSVSASAASQFEKNNQISCEEQGFGQSINDGSEEPAPVGELQILLDKDGNASEIKLKRIKSNGLPALNLVLTTANSKINHAIVKLNVDPDMTSIFKAETITAKDNKGNSLILALNHHTYSGSPGSVLELTIRGKKLSTLKIDHHVSCTGQLRMPIKTVFDDELLK